MTKPLPCSPEMARAYAGGRKTVTRRIADLPKDTTKVLIDPGGTIFGPGPYLKAFYPDGDDDELMQRVFSDYQVGDRLFVREGWAPDLGHFGASLAYEADETYAYGLSPDNKISLERIQRGTNYRFNANLDIRRWAPAKKMPRWAARTHLRVVSIRAERLQDITEDDVRAEGIEFDGSYWRSVVHEIKGTLKCWPTAQMAMQKLWDSLHSDPDHKWASDPWVWRIETRPL